MDKNDHQLQLTKLLSISEKEWEVIAKKCKKHIELRIKHKKIFGAHSEKNLAMPATDYYFQFAVEKLYNGEWEWKYDRFPLLNQIIRIIDSKISEEVRKVQTLKAKAQEIKYVDVEASFYDLSEEHTPEYSKEREVEFEKFVFIVRAAIKDDDDLEYLFLCIQEGKNNEEILGDCGWEKKKLYKLVEKLKEKVKAHLKRIKD